MPTNTETFVMLGPTVCEHCQEEEEDAHPGTMNPVLRCPNCQETFCNSCTDMEAWMKNFPRICPHCGWIPGNDQPE